MDSVYMNRFSLPVVTGTPSFSENKVKPKADGQEGSSFQEILNQNLGQTNALTFSKHAVTRVEQRKVELTPNRIERLHEGVRLAEQKGLNDTLILVDQTAFIVNVKNSTVITTVDSSDLKGNVFTNIDGTVII